MDAMDTSIRRITITEDEDLDLDNLLLGDNSGAGAVPSPPPSSPRPHLPPSCLPSPPCSPTAQCPASPILACEEDVDGGSDRDAAPGEWVLPAPAQPGDYLANSLHRVPSKSILKTTSSYGNFDALTSSATGDASGDASGGVAKKSASCLNFRGLDSSSTSQGSVGRHSRSKVANNSSMDSHRPKGTSSHRTKQTSFLSQASSSSGHSAVGWDMDASPSPSRPNTMLSLEAADIPQLPRLSLDDATSDADVAAGMDTSRSIHSGTSSNKIRRNVSFHSVDVREYDRTVGDNPSCRSGPPLSLDWSYSKKYERDIEEYEADRSTERVTSLRKLHMNKYKRRNMLAFHWGHTEDEMKEARKHTKRMQRQRSVTKMMLPLYMAEEAFLWVKGRVTKKRDDASMGASTEDSSHRYPASPSAGQVAQDALTPSDRTA